MHCRCEWPVLVLVAMYLQKLTRKQAITIFRARCRMTQVIKDSYKNAWPDMNCWACMNHPETQNHALKHCSMLHRNHENTTSEEEIFSKNIETLRAATIKIEKIKRWKHYHNY